MSGESRTSATDAIEAEWKEVTLALQHSKLLRGIIGSIRTNQYDRTYVTLELPVKLLKDSEQPERTKPPLNESYTFSIAISRPSYSDLHEQVNNNSTEQIHPEHSAEFCNIVEIVASTSFGLGNFYREEILLRATPHLTIFQIVEHTASTMLMEDFKTERGTAPLGDFCFHMAHYPQISKEWIEDCHYYRMKRNDNLGEAGPHKFKHNESLGRLEAILDEVQKERCKKTDQIEL